MDKFTFEVESAGGLCLNRLVNVKINQNGEWSGAYAGLDWTKFETEMPV